MQGFALSNSEGWASSPALPPRRLRHRATAAGVRRHRGPSPALPPHLRRHQHLGDSAGIHPTRLGKAGGVLGRREEQADWRQHVWSPGRASASQCVCVCIRTAGDVAQAEMRLANVLQTHASQEGDLARQPAQISACFTVPCHPLTSGSACGQGEGRRGASGKCLCGEWSLSWKIPESSPAALAHCNQWLRQSRRTWLFVAPASQVQQAGAHVILQGKSSKAVVCSPPGGRAEGPSGCCAAADNQFCPPVPR